MCRLVLALIATTPCVVGCDDPRPVELDVAGRSYLAPLRNDALAVPRLIERLKLRPDATVADIGAGPGFLTLPLARTIPEGRVIATDIKKSYLDALEARAAEQGLDNIDVRLVREDQSGLEAGSVDLVLMCQVDQLLEDRETYFRGLIPALKRGGRIVLVNYVRFREVDRRAAEAASLSVVEEWQPSPPFFVMVLSPAAIAKAGL